MIDVEQKSNWTRNDIDYLKNVTITEYDLRSGGFSVIKEYKLLDQKYIDEISKLEKEQQKITIGKLQIKIPDLSKKMVEGFGKARKEFVTKNNVSEDNILSIKKDALFLINCFNITGKLSDNLEFREKNSYSSYIRLNNKEFYYSSSANDLDVKGLGDKERELQQLFLLKNIKIFLKQAEKISKYELYKSLKDFRSKYLNRKLPVETYRNLDSGTFIMLDSNFEMDNVNEQMVNNIDISYNYKYYIMPLIQKILL